MLYQRFLFGGGEFEIDAGVIFERVHFDDQSWIDIARDWMHGADTLLDALLGSVGWKQGKRWMYERMVDDPRLSRWYLVGERVLHSALDQVRWVLIDCYRVLFGSVGFNYYRDGDDSVVWYSDKELRELEDIRIAILILGARCVFLICLKQGGKLRDIKPGFGDLFVMGGRVQMDWEYNVLKIRRVVGSCIFCFWRWMRG